MIVLVENDNKMTDRKSKKYLIVNNHVREIPIQYKTNDSNSTEENCVQNVSSNDEQRTKKKHKKRRHEDINAVQEALQISESDLQELRTVYRKCKAVVKKIEMKYGHLLDLDSEASSSKQNNDSDEITDECMCERNKKIVFDDEGQQKTVNTTPEAHICPKKPKEIPKYKNIEIQYTEEAIDLPNNLPELLKLLQNPYIENTLRHKVIYKIRSMKEEVLNEIKFNKHSLIEKLKNNSDELLSFEGTNLSSLPGYL